MDEPVPLLLERVLRALVRRHAAVPAAQRGGSAGRRAVLHVGIPGGATRRFAPDVDDRLDHALRVEVVEAMARDDLRAGRVPLAWLTHEVDGPDEEDLAWAAAAAAAGGELGVTLTLVVVTPRSWRDPRTGVGRTWRRLRRPGGVAAEPGG